MSVQSLSERYEHVIRTVLNVLSTEDEQVVFSTTMTDVNFPCEQDPDGFHPTTALSINLSVTHPGDQITQVARVFLSWVHEPTNAEVSEILMDIWTEMTFSRQAADLEDLDLVMEAIAHGEEP